MRRYSEYKASGVTWVGKIPKHWNVKRAKFIFRRLQRLVREHDEIITAFRDGIVTLRKNRRTLGFTNSLKEIGYQGLRKGDLVIHAMDGHAGAIGVSDSDGKSSPVYSVCRPISQENVHYYAYLLRYMALSGFIESLAKGIRERSTEFRFNEFKELDLLIPPVFEQTQIANFLNRKTGQIDELIRIKQRRIELLREQRTALINQAVTKGLDPNVEMKPSGVEWIGEIPKDWEAIPIKHTLQIAKDSIRTGPFGSSLKSHEFQDKGIRVYNQQSVYNEDFSKSDIFISEEKFNELRSYIVQPKDVLITSRGTIGKMTIVPENGEIGVLHPCLIRLRLNENKLIPKYLWWYVNHSSLFIESVKIESNATTIEVIYSETLSSVKIPIPTVREQLEILEFLNVKIPIIDTKISNTRKRIELLKEYRQSLISEAVTGKIDVRNEV